MKTTHPDIAALVTPLYASLIEWVKGFTVSNLFPKQHNLLNPLSGEAEERVAARSAGGVSKIVGMLNSFYS